MPKNKKKNDPIVNKLHIIIHWASLKIAKKFTNLFKYCFGVHRAIYISGVWCMVVAIQSEAITSYHYYFDDNESYKTIGSNSFRSI